MEAEEIKVKKAFLEFLNKEIIFSGSPQDNENRKYQLVDKLFEIYIKLNPTSFIPPENLELSTS